MFSSTLRSVRTQPGLFISPSPYRKSNSAIFQQIAAGSNHPDNQMDKTDQKAHEVTEKGDVMSHSFGEGYSTRSDEEGFGGVYGGNQSLAKGNGDKEDKNVHGNCPEFDKTQGSEVKEKEKGRHQSNASA